MKKIKLILPVIASLFIFSCSNYTDINQNPNDVLYSNLAPSELLSAAQTNTYRTQSITMNRLGSILTNAWSENATIYGATIFNQQQYTLEVNSNFGASVWNNLYLNINNFDLLSKYPNPNGQYDYYVAIAKICKAHYIQYIFDLYGNAPYSQAFGGALNVTPSYDDDQVAYRAEIADLEAAWTIINNAQTAGTADDVSASDVMLNGVMDDWKAFANTVELRMLLRMSGNTGATAAYRDAHLAVVASRPFVSADVKINPGYDGSASASSGNPYWYNFVNSSDNIAIVPSGHAYHALFNDYPNASTTTIPGSPSVNYANVSDPRASKIFKKGSGVTSIMAITQGAQAIDVVNSTVAANPNASLKLGALGTGLSNPYSQVAATPASNLSMVNGYVMTLTESKMLQAEAKLRGFIPGGDGGAQADFLAAIDASCAFLSVTTAAATTYKNAIAAKPYYGWTGSFDQKLHAIMYQKWVGLMGIHGMESYVDYVRTGFPYTPLALNTTRLNKPVRFIYATTEYTNNSGNVPNVLTGDVFSVNNFSPFWLQGDPALGN